MNTTKQKRTRTRGLRETDEVFHVPGLPVVHEIEMSGNEVDCVVVWGTNKSNVSWKRKIIIK